MEPNNPAHKNEPVSDISPLPIPQITNVVSTAYLGINLDLAKIASKLPNCESIKYRSDSNNISSIKMKIEKPKATVMILKTWKINCFGAKSEEDSKRAIKIAEKNIKKIGYNVELNNFRIVNIVATCQLNFDIRLLEIYQTLFNTKTNRCNYESDVFPGLIYHMNNPEITLLIFCGGKINFVGAKNTTVISDELNKIYPLLLKNKRNLTLK